jgi:hypothetical protein
MYHRQQGNRQIAIPVVDGKEVDLWSLRRETTAMGGYGVVRSASSPQVLL